MEQYRIDLIDRNGTKTHDHVEAESAQAAADCMREEWPGCYILRISQVVSDWK